MTQKVRFRNSSLPPFTVTPHPSNNGTTFRKASPDIILAFSGNPKTPSYVLQTLANELISQKNPNLGPKQLHLLRSIRSRGSPLSKLLDEGEWGDSSSECRPPTPDILLQYRSLNTEYLDQTLGPCVFDYNVVILRSRTARVHY